MRKLIVATAICLCIVSLSSCSGSDTANHALTPANYTFTPAAYGTTQTIGVGDLAVLALPANPSTGYGWHRNWTPRTALKLTKTHYAPNEPQLDGSGGTQYYEFKATRTGTVVVTVQYGQWWAGGQTEKPQTLTLNIVSHSVTLAQLDGSQSMRVGESLVVKLPENGSTGYSWKHSWVPQRLLSLARDYYVAPDAALPGAGGTRCLVFKALAAGQVDVTVQYGRWWEGGEREDPHTMTLNLTP